MKYLKFREFLKNQPVFSQKDIRLFDANFDLNILSDWQKKGYINKLRKGFYLFNDIQVNDALLYHISNKIYSPSYISFELALSTYGLIPDTVFSVTAASTNKTNQFKTNFGIFYYKHLKPDLFFGYTIEDHHSIKYAFANIEKAVLDYFYIYSDLKTKKDFDSVRFDYELFFETANRNKLEKYLTLFDSKALRKRIENLEQAAKGDN